MAFQVAMAGQRPRVVPSMNVTPLVDVVLVLLIIFMVITPMMVKKFWLHVPKPDNAAAPPQPADNDVPIVLTVRTDRSLWINKERVERSSLAAKLERMVAARRDAVIFFDAGDQLPYGEAMRVLDEARAGGAINIAVLTESVVR